MNQIPSDLIFEICKHLPHTSVGRLSQTNHHFQVVCSNENIWLHKCSQLKNYVLDSQKNYLNQFKSSLKIPLYHCKTSFAWVHLRPFGFLKRSHFKTTSDFLLNRMFKNTMIIILDSKHEFVCGFIILSYHITYVVEDLSNHNSWVENTFSSQEHDVLWITKRSQWCSTENECFLRLMSDVDNCRLKNTVDILDRIKDDFLSYQNNFDKICLSDYSELPKLDTLTFNFDPIFKKNVQQLIKEGNTIILCYSYERFKDDDPDCNHIRCRVVYISVYGNTVFNKFKCDRS